MAPNPSPFSSLPQAFSHSAAGFRRRRIKGGATTNRGADVGGRSRPVTQTDARRSRKRTGVETICQPENSKLRAEPVTYPRRAGQDRRGGNVGTSFKPRVFTFPDRGWLESMENLAPGDETAVMFPQPLSFKPRSTRFDAADRAGVFLALQSTKMGARFHHLLLRGRTIAGVARIRGACFLHGLRLDAQSSLALDRQGPAKSPGRFPESARSGEGAYSEEPLAPNRGGRGKGC